MLVRETSIVYLREHQRNMKGCKKIIKRTNDSTVSWENKIVIVRFDCVRVTTGSFLLQLLEKEYRNGYIKGKTKFLSVLIKFDFI